MDSLEAAISRQDWSTATRLADSLEIEPEFVLKHTLADQLASIERGTICLASLETVIYLGDSQVDVHGAGAGGGAATVLAAAAAQQVSPTAALGPQQGMRVTTHTHDIREHGPDQKGLDADREPIPTSYNPDQFRSCNRIHWTKEEEELLMTEVEINWERYDCMAHIMKRHGPKGSVSRAFADRTGVSLKDKAVNISSKWYRDGTEVSAARRRAFARFRPKQLRGKPRSELPGMGSLPDYLSPAHSDPQNLPQHSSFTGSQ